MAKRVIFRADDAGSSVGTNEAMIEVAKGGLVRNIGLMAPGLAIEDARRLQGLDVCFGMHAVINAEWDLVKWGPVASPSLVPSLLEASGFFTNFPSVLNSRGCSVEEIELELRAQHALLTQLGFQLTYLDEHMGFSWLPGVRPLLERLADEFNLVYAPEIPYWNPFDSKPSPDAELCLCVFHPSQADQDSAKWWHEGLVPGAVAEERDRERQLLAHPPAIECVVPSTYRDAVG